MLSQGEQPPRTLAGIKNEKIKTCWFTVWNKTSISKPYVLHTSVKLELGDLFINKFYSQQHETQVLQVWLLVKGSNSNNLMWRQVRDWFNHSSMVPDGRRAKVVSNEKTYHPKLKDRVLGFQPNDTSVPTWIKPTTERRVRAMPVIVKG